MLFGFVQWPIFFVSLIIGAVFVYLSAPSSKTVFVYPTPDNVNRYIYKDDVGTCHKYVPQEAQCSENTKDIPPQVMEKSE